MKIIETTIRHLIEAGRPLCCIVEDVVEAFFITDASAKSLVQCVLLEDAI